MEATVANHEASPGLALRALLDLFADPKKPILPSRLRSAYSREIADEVLEATSLEDLGDRLYAMGGDQMLWDSEVDARANTSPRGMGLDGLDMPSLVRTLGPTAARRCEQGWKAYRESLHRVEILVRALGEPSGKLPSPASVARKYERITDILYDVDLWPSLREGVGLLLRSLASGLVIARAEERPQALPPWLALGLANYWAEVPEMLASKLMNPQELLLWFATVISEDVRVDKLRTTFEQWNCEGLSSSSEVYFPLLETPLDSE